MSKQKNLEPTKDGGTVVGLFKDQVDAEQAIERLKKAGFSESQIGVAIRDRSQQEELIEGTGTQAAEGATTGAIGGGVLGGVIGLLAGVGALAIPGIGPIIAGGALASTLAGAGIGAAAGGLLGALTGMGIPEEDARHFDEGFRAGGTLVTVNAGSRNEEARECLLESGADLGSMSSGTRGGTMSTGAAPADRSAEDSSVVELREEELRVEKERVQAGEVRLRKEVVTEKRTVEVPVTREEVVIERRPAARGTEAGGTIDDGEEIRIPLMEEEVRVEKTPVVREEVTLKKRQVQDTEQVSETVRREEARIEQTGDSHLSGSGAESTEAWRGNERRYRDDASYKGPERRTAEV
ncbi:MAG: YsnF/AvaK domain-containing protein [Gemmatimonadales bacterium]|nr:YsnF/AvaK domain-containing protein [Gemmatimonadales bacterium]